MLMLRPLVPGDGDPVTPGAAAPTIPDADAPMIPGDAVPGSRRHLGALLGILITLVSSSKTRLSSGLEG